VVAHRCRSQHSFATTWIADPTIVPYIQKHHHHHPTALYHYHYHFWTTPRSGNPAVTSWAVLARLNFLHYSVSKYRPRPGTALPRLSRARTVLIGAPGSSSISWRSHHHQPRPGLGERLLQGWLLFLVSGTGAESEENIHCSWSPGDGLI